MASRTIALVALGILATTLTLSASGQIPPKAAYVSISPDKAIVGILEGEGFLVEEVRDVPSDLSGYNLVVVDTIGSSVEPHLENIRKYVRNGGGYAYIGGIAYWSDLEDNGWWLGAGSVEYTGRGESAFVTTHNPLGTGLKSGDVLKQQPPEELGAQFVDDLKQGATRLAEYSGGGVYAYTYSYGDGRIYYHADTNPSIAAGAGERIKTLMAAGFKWAAGRSAPSALGFVLEGAAAGKSGQANHAGGEHAGLYAKIQNNGVMAIDAGCLEANVAVYDRSGKEITEGRAANKEPLEAGKQALIGFDYRIPPDLAGWYSIKADAAILERCGGDGHAQSITSRYGLLVARPGQLPAGTKVASGQPYAGEMQRVFFDNPGPETGEFAAPPEAVRGIYASVTTYIEDAVLHFKSDGAEYLLPVPPDTNLIMAFPAPTAVSNIWISIADRGYPDNQANVAFYYEEPPIFAEDESQTPIDGLIYVVAPAVAAGSIVALFLTRRHSKPSAAAQVDKLITRDNDQKKKVLEELSDELGSDLRPAQSVEDLLGKFRQDRDS